MSSRPGLRHCPNEGWSINFVSDSLANAQSLRVSVIVDDVTRECVATEVDTSFLRPALTVYNRLREETQSSSGDLRLLNLRMASMTS
jgi:hypothetical protein